MPKLIVHLHGPFRTTEPDGRAQTGLSRRAQGRLAYLACQSGFRAECAMLADLLWSDRSENQARASLRQELSTLRRLLPAGLLSADRQAVWLGSDLLACERGDGDFLQGFDLPSEGFEDWLRAERARTHVPPTSGPASAGRDRIEQPALAVMPFEELGVTQKDMFAEGVVEEITGALSRMQAFHLRATADRYSTFLASRQA